MKKLLQMQNLWESRCVGSELIGQMLLIGFSLTVYGI